jgi:leucine dehydrogenase
MPGRGPTGGANLHNEESVRMEIRRKPIEGYEEVYRCTDPRTGLLAYIAVHDTTLGPALGGCRMWHYSREEDALTDVLRLSKGMTYKSAVARTGLGGGKAVIVGDPKVENTPELFRSMGRFVHTLAGRYTTAEDVGTNEQAMLYLREVTPYVTGLPRGKGGSGDPSPYTAHGCFQGLKAAVEEQFDRSDLTGLRVAVQGIGNVGYFLAKELREAGAELIITDVNKLRLQEVGRELGAQVVEPKAIYSVDCDVFAPCALGAIINDQTIPLLKCKVVAGASNNQLAEERHGEALLQRGILYAPDFVINAGGIINVSVEFLPGGYDEAVASPKVKNIYQAIKDIIRTGKEQGIPTSQAAIVLAEEILAEGRARNENKEL